MRIITASGRKIGSIADINMTTQIARNNLGGRVAQYHGVDDVTVDHNGNVLSQGNTLEEVLHERFG
jgi:hypothetical protein